MAGSSSSLRFMKMISVTKWSRISCIVDRDASVVQILDHGVLL